MLTTPIDTWPAEIRILLDNYGNPGNFMVCIFVLAGSGFAHRLFSG
jgi:hypothetical protein